MTSSRPTTSRRQASPAGCRPNATAQARRAKMATAKGPNHRNWVMAGMIAAVLVVTGALYVTFAGSAGTGTSKAGDYQVGTPGVGATAPTFTLPSTTGARVSLRSFRGKSVLLYFHEGLGCQPCWDQIRDLDGAASQLKGASVDTVLTITSGPAELIAQKMADDKLRAVALADSDLSVSRTYNATQYGMMGTDRDGHSFILVGPDGRIQWRADYGGSPKYTMFVPVERLLADLKAGRRTS